MTSASTVEINSSEPWGSPPSAGRKSKLPFDRAMKPSTLVPTKTDTVMASTFSATRVRVKSEFESAQAACASERHAYFRIYLCAAVPVKISDEHEIHHRRHSRPHRPWED